MSTFPYIITVSSEKGGVGKTTLATNLAIYLKALDEDLPVTIFSFDNHFTVDRMFEIKGQPLVGDVSGLLQGTTGSSLLHTGQYGVNYIPSAKNLHEMKHAINGSLLLARLLASSQIPGIIIIDTRPELDILTQNALFAADKVIIPVKDMASLENCRNIFELFDRKGFDRKSLSLIPCIIDSRIKFDGPFRDQRALLKAYAINRGYRCMDMYISKSPKVESLGTNPSGRVYPILTYARHTEVHSQFAQLAGAVLNDFRAVPAPRSSLFHQWLVSEEERKRSSLADRHAALRPDCLFCKRPLLQRSDGTIGYYFETSDGAARGFLEDACFSGLLVSTIFNLGKDLSPRDPGFQMFKEATKDSSYVFRSSGSGSGGAMVEFSRFDGGGSPLVRKLFPVREYDGGFLSRNRNRLYTLMTEIFAEDDGNRGDAFLLVHPVDPADPERILQEEHYRDFSLLRDRIAEQIALTVPS